MQGKIKGVARCCGLGRGVSFRAVHVSLARFIDCDLFFWREGGGRGAYLTALPPCSFENSLADIESVLLR